MYGPHSWGEKKKSQETNYICRTARHPPGGASDDAPRLPWALGSWTTSRISVVPCMLQARGVIEEEPDMLPTWVTGLGIWRYF